MDHYSLAIFQDKIPFMRKTSKNVSIIWKKVQKKKTSNIRTITRCEVSLSYKQIILYIWYIQNLNTNTCNINPFIRATSENDINTCSQLQYFTKCIFLFTCIKDVILYVYMYYKMFCLLPVELSDGILCPNLGSFLYWGSQFWNGKNWTNPPTFTCSKNH